MQMCVVNDKQVSPIWINHNTLIRVRATLPLGMYVVMHLVDLGARSVN